MLPIAIVENAPIMCESWVDGSIKHDLGLECESWH